MARERLRDLGKATWLLMIPALALLVGAALSAQTDPSSSDELIARANELFPERYVRAKMEEAIALYERVLPQLDALSVQTQAFVLDRLAQLHYEVTTFGEDVTSEERPHLEKGKDYGFRSLRLNPDFARWERPDFGKAIGFVTDPAAINWTANSWGKIFQLDPWQGLANVGKLMAMYRRCIALDEAFWGGSCHHSLGALLVTTPGFLGGDAEEGKGHLERALELDPDYLMNHVVYAEYWGFSYNMLGNKNGVRDRALIEREASFVLEAPIGNAWPFWNREAKAEAERLLKELKRF